MVTYEAVDSSGNAAAQVTRTVVVEDTLAPVIAAVTDVAVECAGPAGDGCGLCDAGRVGYLRSVSGGVVRAAIGCDVCVWGYDRLVHGGGCELECFECVICCECYGYAASYNYLSR